MAEPIVLDIELADKMSEPAARIVSVLDRLDTIAGQVNQSFARTEALMETVAGSMSAVAHAVTAGAHAYTQVSAAARRYATQTASDGRKRHEELMATVRDLGQVEAKQKEVAAASASSAAALAAEAASSPFGAVIAGAQAAVAVVGEVVGKLREYGGMAVSFVSRVAVGSAGRQNILLGLESVLGSRKDAEEEYEKLQKIANLTGQHDKDLLPAAQQMLAAHFSRPEAHTNLLGVGDLLARAGKLDAFGPAIEQLTKMKSSGRIDLEEVRTLSHSMAGTLPLETLAEVIGEQRKISTKAATHLLTQGEGKISSNEVFAALTEVYKRTNKSLTGDTMIGRVDEKFANDLTSTLSTLENRWNRLFEHADVSPITNLLSRVSDLLDTNSASGQALIGTINHLFCGLIDPILKRYEGPNGAEQLAVDFDQAANEARKLAEAVVEIAHAIAQTLSAAESFGNSKFGKYAVHIATEGLVMGPIRAASEIEWDSSVEEMKRRQKVAKEAAINPPNQVEVPHFASGGWAGMSGPELAMVGDGGEPELITPLSKITGFGSMPAAGGSPSFSWGDLHFHVTTSSGTDTEAVANEVARLVPGALQSTMERLAGMAAH